jgi:hypothetical protein
MTMTVYKGDHPDRGDFARILAKGYASLVWDDHHTDAEDIQQGFC